MAKWGKPSPVTNYYTKKLKHANVTMEIGIHVAKVSFHSKQLLSHIMGRKGTLCMCVHIYICIYMYI